MTDFSLRAARIQLGALLAALALAIVIALGITTGAFVLSFAVQRDLARQALIPEHLTWIFPAIVDSAILGATIAIVIISKLNMNKRDRGFYIALDVSVVVISILGNAYHAYHAAIAAQESIDGGGDLGFIPLAPAIAAAIAIIPPALVLAFTHGITILVKAVGMAYAAYRAIVESATDSEDATSIASDLTVGRGPIRVPQPREKIAHNIAEQEDDDLDVDAKAVDAKAGNEDAFADFAEPFFVDEMTNEGLDDILDPQDAATEFPDRRAVEEAQADTDADIDDLMSFIARSNLAKNVKDTAVRKLTNPNLTWETIALESKPPVATSTAWRRYEKFDAAAREAGFDSPPLPDLRAAENPMRSELATV
ncbi:DUF2637 domain-containing protein [Rhodococcus erythropolis]|uniref:DUF2637 domain-containing protein n=3 Tax=Rhodococcus TaxID=1827 RepID=A0AB38RLV3_RHOSG|nr:MULTISPECIES: DUF2637 domain-containing protein [Rhodococcus]MCQ4128842.1 DUF2637 domain-containing protein [Rhodococcus erythropolis]MDV6212570.1 DUF2637 domain-containing protein [Rhodococcus erythropolis]NDK72935.1 DUF2637 domain-containing protein [Rhodococcus qingshengii]QSE44339.1 DUF2637 domain-containing protein [Rhodococcus erythropolis]UPU46293.1 DUF2637 domain-containing protein [Rhodococcus qingshengii JCM 15477]